MCFAVGVQLPCAKPERPPISTPQAPPTNSAQNTATHTNSVPDSAQAGNKNAAKMNTGAQYAYRVPQRISVKELLQGIGQSTILLGGVNTGYLNQDYHNVSLQSERGRFLQEGGPTPRSHNAGLLYQGEQAAISQNQGNH